MEWIKSSKEKQIICPRLACPLPWSQSWQCPVPHPPAQSQPCKTLNEATPVPSPWSCKGRQSGPWVSVHPTFYPVVTSSGMCGIAWLCLSSPFTDILATGLLHQHLPKPPSPHSLPSSPWSFLSGLEDAGHIKMRELRINNLLWCLSPAVYALQ